MYNFLSNGGLVDKIDNAVMNPILRYDKHDGFPGHPRIPQNITQPPIPEGSDNDPIVEIIEPRSEQFRENILRHCIKMRIHNN